MDENIGEECGVFGVYVKNPKIKTADLTSITYPALYSLQHRGQLSAGQASYNDSGKGEILRVLTEVGPVEDLFKLKKPHKKIEIQRYLSGIAAINHVRYATSGLKEVPYMDLKREAQPFYRPHPRPSKRFALGFNGNLANCSALRKEMMKEGYKLDTTVDTEIIMNLISYAINILSSSDLKGNYVPADLFKVFEGVSTQMDGSYNLLTLFGDGNLVTVRDPHGFRPLVFGENKDFFAVASESVALERIGIKKFEPVEPGSCMVFNMEKGLESRIIAKAPRKAHCHFERTYFSRADSSIDGKSINSSREKLGINLARSDPLRKKFMAHPEDYIVVPVPKTAIPAAETYARELGLDLTHAIMTSDSARGFINRTSERSRIMEKKYSVIAERVKGKKAIIVDDSIIRGETDTRVVKMVREAGAIEAHLRSTEPPTRHPCFYGVDFASYCELIANQVKGKNFERGVAKRMGADSVHYQTEEGSVDAMGFSKDELCMACVNGEYPTEWGRKNAERAERLHRRKKN